MPHAERGREIEASRSSAPSAGLRAVAPPRTALRRYASTLRVSEILMLQAPPFFGVAMAAGAGRAPDLVGFALLMAGNILLMAHVFLLNDWAGQTLDLADPKKTQSVFTRRGVSRREIERIAATLLIGALASFAFVSATAFCLGAAIAVLSTLYSAPPFHWKGVPFLGSIAHVAGGVLHFVLGYSLAGPVDARGLALATFFAVSFAAGHLMQEVRDYESDRAGGIRTIAVTFGARRAFIGGVAAFTVAYALLIGMAVTGMIPRALTALAILYPLHLHWSVKTLRGGMHHQAVARLQTRYRCLYAIIGVVLLLSAAATAFNGSSRSRPAVFLSTPQSLLAD